jgi:hypothetical protein
MKTRFIVLTLIFTVVFSFPAEGQVSKCTDRVRVIQDSSLQRALEQLQEKYPNISFQEDDQPCRQAQDTVRALTRTFGNNHLRRFDGYEFAKVINGEEYFTVERFQIADANRRSALATALKNHWSRKLKIEANTSYEYFASGDSVVIMISSATGREENSRLFQKVQEFMSSLIIKEDK